MSNDKTKLNEARDLVNNGAGVDDLPESFGPTFAKIKSAKNDGGHPRGRSESGLPPMGMAPVGDNIPSLE